jgi:hypothetical protein
MRTALSLHAPLVPPACVDSGVPVPGVIVTDGSAVDAVEVCVGMDGPGRVGGRVEVTKRGGAAVEGPGAILTQEVNGRIASRVHIQIFFMCKFYFEIMKQL